jgi:hypothetical protein
MKNLSASDFAPAMVLQTKKIKSYELLKAVRHVLREITVGSYQERQGIDPNRSGLNRVLRGKSSSEQVLAEHSQLAESVRYRKDAVAALEVVISTPVGFQRSNEYFEASISFFERFWGCPTLLAVTHNDQSHPHLHLLVAPFKDGRLCGSATIGYKAAGESLRRNFHSQVASRYGFLLHDYLTTEARRSVAKSVKTQIMTDPGPLMSGHLGSEFTEVLFAGAHKLVRFFPR